MSKTKEKVAGKAGEKPEDQPNAGAVAVVEKRDLKMVDYGDDAGSGFENQTQDDIGIPFIDILQPGSPEVQDQPEGGARAGMIINRTTGEIIDGKKGFVFVPAITEHCYTEWKPRKDANDNPLKGGFVARHELTEDIVIKARVEAPFKAYKMPNGNELLETFYVPSSIVDDDTGGYAPAMLAFTSSKIKPYKGFSYVARAIMVPKPGGGMQNPPIFSHKYRYTTLMKREGAKTWYIPVITFEVPNDAEASRLAPGDLLYEGTKAMKLAYQKGEVKVDLSKTSDDRVGNDDPNVKPPF